MLVNSQTLSQISEKVIIVGLVAISTFITSSENWLRYVGRVLLGVAS